MIFYQKAFLFTAIVLAVASIANADLTLTVNGLDTSNPIEIKSQDIVIGVAGKPEQLKQVYSITCEAGGKLETLAKPKHTGKKGEYLFTFDKDRPGLAVINLTVDDVLGYQLALFAITEFDTVIIFGIDSDEIEIPKPEPDPEPKPFMDLLTNTVTYWERKEQEKLQSLKSCPKGIPFRAANELKSLQAKEYKDREIVLTGVRVGMPLEETVVDVDSDITSNTIWVADNTYHVVADVNVQALLVVEPGTVVAFGPGKAMKVNNGGTLISVGTPDNPIIYTSDSGTPGYADYGCPMYIEETASSATKIMYNYVEYAHTGLLILNNDLDTDIQHNYFYKNVYGIVEQGIHHTDICNNLIVDSYYSGIEVFLESSTSQADANSCILIQNNTCDYYQDFGITVHGVPDNSDAGLVILANNIVSESYQYGLNLVDGYMYASVLNTGYYGNANNKNWEFEETNPVIENEWPYREGAGALPVCYLSQDCNFIDAGTGWVDKEGVIGLTTDANGAPDSNITDIGFHYCHWDYTNTGEGDFLAGDLNYNWHTDFKDFAILANDWQTTYDFNEFAALAGTWLKYGGPTPNIVPSFNQDPNNVSGDLRMTINVPEPNIHRVFVMLDGERYGEFDDLFEFADLIMETEPYLNGTHSIKIVYMYDDMAICSQPIEVIFNNNISALRGSDGFVPGEDYHLYGLGNGTYRVQVEDIVNENIVYSQTFTDNVEVHIDANSFPEEYGLYEIDIDQETLLLIATWQDIVEKVIGRKFKKEDFPQDWPIKMVVSIGDKKLEKDKEKCWRACVKAAVRKGIWPVFLNAKACTWDNLSYCLQLNKVKMWYHVSHGNYDLLGQPPRQCISTANGKVFSYLKKDFDPNHIPPDYKKLSWFYENNHSIAELGLVGSSKMIWVQFNACYSAHTTEFPVMLGILPIKDPLMIGKQIFIGWKESALVHDILGKYNQFEEDYWDFLRQGYNLKDSVEYALPPVGGTIVLENFAHCGVVDWQYAWFKYPDIN